MKDYYAVFMLTALTVFASVSCTKGSREKETPPLEKTYVVSLALAGNIDVSYDH